MCLFNVHFKFYYIYLIIIGVVYILHTLYNVYIVNELPMHIILYYIILSQHTVLLYID